MRTTKLLALAGIALIIGVALGTHSASAQVPGRPIADTVACTTSRFDYNGDALLGKSDMMELWRRIQSSGCNEAEAAGGCAQYDTNGDGTVNFDDVQFVYDYFVTCFQPIQVPEVAKKPGGR